MVLSQFDCSGTLFGCHSVFVKHGYIGKYRLHLLVFREAKERHLRTFHNSLRVTEEGREGRLIPQFVMTVRDKRLGILDFRKAAGLSTEQVVEMGR